MPTEAECLEALAISREALREQARLRDWYAERLEDALTRLAVTEGCERCQARLDALEGE